MGARPLSRLETAVFDALLNAARSGAPCPSNDDLCSIHSSPAGVVKNLEKRGLIKVDRYQRARQVTIVETGEQTKAPAVKTPHWRTRPGRTRTQQVDALADRVAEHGNRALAAKEIGVSASYGRVLWGEIVRGLGWQAV